MEPNQPRKSPRRILMLLAAGVFAALLLLPMTRYLFLSQLQMEFFPSNSQKEAERLHQTAMQHPGDYELQLADALNPTEEPGKYLSVSKRERLQELAKQFPDRASVYANMLRFMSQGEAVSKRDEEYLFSGESIPAIPRHTAAPEIMAIYDQAALDGERLDPTNGYFPLMRAAGLFSSHRDAEAMQELHRAAQSARWDDFCQDEVIGEERLSEAAYGRRPALYRLCQSASIVFPHYSRMRAAAKLAVYNAVTEEKTGSLEAGFAVREDVLRIGSLIRSQSRWSIGTQVGIAITDIGMIMPGGAPLDKSDPNRDFSIALQSDGTRCVAYFEGIGHQDTAAWLKSEIEASKQAREIIQVGQSKSVFDYFRWERLSNIPLWMLGSLLPLANIVTLLEFGALGYVLLRMRAGKAPLWLRGVVFVAFMGLLAGWQCRMVEGALSVWIELCRNLGVKELPYMIDNPGWFTFACFAAPVLMLFALSVMALFGRVPLHLAFARGMRHLALPVACVLILVYGVLMVGISYQDHRLNDHLNRMEQHEGKYLADLVGKEWPGPVK